MQGPGKPEMHNGIAVIATDTVIISRDFALRLKGCFAAAPLPTTHGFPCYLICIFDVSIASVCALQCPSQTRLLT